MSGTLLVEVNGKSAIFDGEFTIGSRGADLIVDDEYVSPMHARVFRQHGQWLIEDLGSANGTFCFSAGGWPCNGDRVYLDCPLEKGDRIRIGRTVLTFVPV